MKGKKKKPVVCPECKGSGTSYLNEKGESDHMNAHTCGSCYGGGSRKEDNEIQAQRVQHIALVIGYNELAKQGKTLGEKLYYRIFRDHSEEAFIKMGGHKMLTHEDGICEIKVPGHTPHIVFQKSDIELMRKAVSEHDAKGATDACDHGYKHWGMCPECNAAGMAATPQVEAPRKSVVSSLAKAVRAYIDSEDQDRVAEFDAMEAALLVEEQGQHHCGDLKCLSCNEQAEHDERKNMEELIAASIEFVRWRESPPTGTAVPFVRWLHALKRVAPDEMKVVLKRHEDEVAKELEAEKEEEKLREQGYVRCKYCNELITSKDHPQARWAEPHKNKYCLQTIQEQIDNGELIRVKK